MTGAQMTGAHIAGALMTGAGAVHTCTDLVAPRSADA